MSTTHSKANCRRYPRQTVRILVDYLASGLMGSEYATTLGAGGVFIEADPPLTRGSALKVRFRLPGAEDLHVIEGKVVWSHTGSAYGAPLQAPGFAVQFTDNVAVAKLARELEDFHA